jgi:hypothetical protein
METGQEVHYACSGDLSIAYQVLGSGNLDLVLVAGSGLRFHDRGVHALDGIPGEWHLFAAEAPA